MYITQQDIEKFLLVYSLDVLLDIYYLVQTAWIKKSDRNKILSKLENPRAQLLVSQYSQALSDNTQLSADFFHSFDSAVKKFTKQYIFNNNLYFFLYCMDNHQNTR